MSELEDILNYLETTSLEPHDDYVSEFSYKEQKLLWAYIKELQQENQELKNQLEEKENQQKEFIEYLESKIDTIIQQKETFAELEAGQAVFLMTLAIALDKYKKIIGGKDE